MDKRIYMIQYVSQYFVHNEKSKFNIVIQIVVVGVCDAHCAKLVLKECH